MKNGVRNDKKRTYADRYEEHCSYQVYFLKAHHPQLGFQNHDQKTQFEFYNTSFELFM